MRPRSRTVAIKKLPLLEQREEVSALLEELYGCLRMDRPRIVLNCSNARTLGRPDLHLLLCCLEEAMKRNGDVRLSAVPQAALAVLEATGIYRLFRIYDNDTEAVMSFQNPSTSAMPEPDSTAIAVRFDGSAADALFETTGDPISGAMRSV